MQVIRYNISKPRKYKDRNGNEKTQWNNIGTMTEFHKDDGSIGRILEIPAISLEASIFPIEKREPAPARPSPLDQAMGSGRPPIEEIPTINIDHEIKAEDLPF